MRRRWICICVALVMFLVSADVASAKKSRASHAASRAHAKREAHSSRASRTSRTKGGKLSRRESSRREKHVRGKVARSGKRSREVASSRRRGRHRGYVTEARTPDAAPARPASSGIPSERATEIQRALIKAGYMDGPPSGQYDDATTQAMKQYQSANGLPQTGLPSAALLKKLGVPKRSNDGYAVPVNTVSETEKKRSTQ